MGSRLAASQADTLKDKSQDSVLDCALDGVQDPLQVMPRVEQRQSFCKS